MLLKVLAVVFLTAYVALAVPVNPAREGYARYVDFPDGEGNMQNVDLEGIPDIELLTEIARNPANNAYLLYTRRNPETPQNLLINNPSSILSSNFQPGRPTVVIAHGWLSSHNTNLNPVIRDAYLQKSNVNVIILDWSRLARSDYLTAVTGVPAVGRGLGQFLDYLRIVTGTPLRSIHLVGFSLGAHLVGNAGRYLNGQVARVTGLDPAGPLWNLNSNRLSSTDGIYVEAIHTDGGYLGLGIGSNLGHADFYPNGGSSQPGCLTNVCNHNRAWELFAASVTYNHLVAQACESSWQLSWNRCRGQEFAMGNDDLNKFGIGTYRVDTARRYPY